MGLIRHIYKTLESNMFWEKATAHRTWMLKGKRMGIWEEVGLELNFSLFPASLYFSKAKIMSYLYLYL